MHCYDQLCGGLFNYVHLDNDVPILCVSVGMMRTNTCRGQLFAITLSSVPQFMNHEAVLVDFCCK